MVIGALGGQRIGAVAVQFIGQAADHLGMAGIAAFADVDLAARQFQRRVRAHVVGDLDGALDGEERRDLDDAADRGHADDRAHEAHRDLLEVVMQLQHALTPPVARRGGGRRRR